MHLKKTVWVKRSLVNGTFKVYKTQNTVKPKIGETLNERSVTELLLAEITVNFS